MEHDHPDLEQHHLIRMLGSRGLSGVSYTLTDAGSDFMVWVLKNVNPQIKTDKPAESATRPRIVLSVTDDGRAIRPSWSHFIVENSGDADAFAVSISEIAVGTTVVKPKTIERLKPGESREVRSDLVSHTTEYDRDFARSLAWACRAINPIENQDQFDGPRIRSEVRVSYRDHDGCQFDDSFSIAFVYGTQKFEEVALIQKPLRLKGPG